MKKARKKLPIKEINEKIKQYMKDCAKLKREAKRLQREELFILRQLGEYEPPS